jgi:glutamine synthetase
MKPLSEFYGELVFNRRAMQERLPYSTFEKLYETINNGKPLDDSIAEEVAHAMKEWAISQGATHFTHWFQPQRGGTAEKHDSFIDFADSGDVIQRFSGKQLIQSEPDASSFPSGGIRSTFEARGYTAWDPTSPAFLIETGKNKTLVIPSVFLSWTGDVLDLKTPFLRSMRALNDACLRLQRLLGNKSAKKINVSCGPEQEYFIVSKKLYDTRPDLQVCGRTIFGAAPAKGQQMEDHYFGAIPEKIIQFMEQLDYELYRRGIPAKTRHNEVSPNQFELAPIFEEANLAIDHNLQIMNIIKGVAEEHGLVALLHEKPFKGLNGSGKHVNWSIGDNTGTNYLEPSSSPQKNLNFLITMAAMMLGVNKFSGLLRACVADAGNDHRLGMHEAPPAIMSIYLGDYLTDLINEIINLSEFNEKSLASISMGVRNLPKINKDYADRNRTSPIAFTGNKFEFRAVGSSQNPSEAVTLLNQLCTYGYYILERRLSALDGSDIKENVMKVLQEAFKETQRIRFEGNSYSEEWKKQGVKLGLPNLRSTPEALMAYKEADAIELMIKTRVLSEREVSAKVEIKLENYVKTMEIEFKTALNIAKTLITPAIMKQMVLVGDANKAVKTVAGLSNELEKDLLVLNNLYRDIKSYGEELEGVLEKNLTLKSCLDKAKHLSTNGGKALFNLRTAVDTAEEMVADEFWPMAKYQKLLTIE